MPLLLLILETLIAHAKILNNLLDSCLHIAHTQCGTTYLKRGKETESTLIKKCSSRFWSQN